ncbi:hypothetical protein [Dictyobacter vulcani]|uniref:hypothetical protein n=1 Tax=Dictyobacter vulcani TaxID=2607529 RepID=UPI0012508881|nr:hypothetical protein [Dictyobacter vulcani]
MSELNREPSRACCVRLRTLCDVGGARSELGWTCLSNVLTGWDDQGMPGGEFGGKRWGGLAVYASGAFEVEG